MRFEEELLLKQQERVNHINKSIETPIEDYLEKARSGVYSNTPENRKLGRVGQKYGGTKQEDVQKKGNDSKQISFTGKRTEEKSEQIKNIEKETGIVFSLWKQTGSYYGQTKDGVKIRLSNHPSKFVEKNKEQGIPSIDLNYEAYTEKEIINKIMGVDPLLVFKKGDPIIHKRLGEMSFVSYDKDKELVTVTNKEGEEKKYYSGIFTFEDKIEKSFEVEDVDIIKSLNTLIESFIEERIDDSIFEKAMAGVYADTSENKKLGRVGQKYGSEGKEDDKKETKGKVTGVDFEHLKRFNLTEEYVNKLIPHMVKNIESTKKFIQNLDKLANKLSEQKGNQSYNEAKNLRNLKVYLLHKMFE